MDTFPTEKLSDEVSFGELLNQAEASCRTVFALTRDLKDYPAWMVLYMLDYHSDRIKLKQITARFKADNGL